MTCVSGVPTSSVDMSISAANISAMPTTGKTL
jgi:hypothetical protein